MSPSALTALFALVFAAVSASSGHAQPSKSPARQLSLEDAMQMASTTTDGVRAARAAARQASARVSAAKSRYWPQITGSASYTRTIASEFDGLFEVPEGMGMMTEELPFGLDNTWRAGLTFTQEIWSFGRTGSQVESARAIEDQAEIALSSAGAQAALAAARAYYDALLAERLLAIAETTLAQAQETFELTRLGFSQGARPEFDLLRAEVARDNQRAVVTQRRSARDLARLRLKEAVGIPLETRLELTTQLDDQKLAATSAAPPARDGGDGLDDDLRLAAGRVDERAGVRLAQSNLRLSSAALDLARAGRFPNLSLVSDLGVVNYPREVFPGVDDWRTNWTVGVVLSVPIFTGFGISAEIDAAEAGVAASRARVSEARRAAAVDEVASRQQVEVTTNTLAQTARTVGQAERAYEIARLRFDQGISSQLDLVDSRLLLDQARENRARAARDLQVAEIRLSLLPNLPLAPAAIAPSAAAPPSSPSTGAPPAGRQTSPAIPGGF